MTRVMTQTDVRYVMLCSVTYVTCHIRLTCKHCSLCH